MRTKTRYLLMRFATTSLILSLMWLAPALSGNSGSAYADDPSLAAKIDNIAVRIQTSPQQRRKIASIVRSHQRSTSPIKQELQKSRHEFLSHIVTGKRPEIIMAKQLSLSKFSSSMEAQHRSMQLEIRRVLTPNQWRLFHQHWQAEIR